METQNSRECLSFRLYIVKKKALKASKHFCKNIKTFAMRIFFI